MRHYTTVILVLVLLAQASHALGEQGQDYKAARKTISAINSLLREGPTDTDTRTIEALFDDLASLSRTLEKTEQVELWKGFPYWAGIACYRQLGHIWAGNDCRYQCGTLEQCKAACNNQIE